MVTCCFALLGSTGEDLHVMSVSDTGHACCGLTLMLACPPLSVDLWALVGEVEALLQVSPSTCWIFQTTACGVRQ